MSENNGTQEASLAAFNDIANKVRVTCGMFAARVVSPNGEEPEYPGAALRGLAMGLMLAAADMLAFYATDGEKLPDDKRAFNTAKVHSLFDDYAMFARGWTSMRIDTAPNEAPIFRMGIVDDGEANIVGLMTEEQAKERGIDV